MYARGSTMSVHARRWWRRRQDIHHLRKTLQSWDPPTQPLIDRQQLVLGQLDELMKALPVRRQPSSHIEIRRLIPG